MLIFTRAYLALKDFKMLTFKMFTLNAKITINNDPTRSMTKMPHKFKTEDFKV